MSLYISPGIHCVWWISPSIHAASKAVFHFSVEGHFNSDSVLNAVNGAALKRGEQVFMLWFSLDLRQGAPGLPVQVETLCLVF